MIDDFVDDGGNFVCWLCGHTHFDSIEKVLANNQRVIVIGTANYTKDSQTLRSADNESFDLFNIVSVDAINRLIKVFRVGSNLSPALQVISSIHFTY